MKDAIRKQMVRQLTPSDNDIAQAIALILATEEHRQLEAAKRLCDAAGIEGVEVARTIEDRQAEILALADAVSDGDVEQFWMDRIGDEFLDAPDEAMKYLGTDEDAWEEQKAKWARKYREKGTFGEDVPVDSIADEHLQAVFGVGLEPFEREVVGWSPGDAAESILATNARDVTQAMHRVADELEDDWEGESCDSC